LNEFVRNSIVFLWKKKFIANHHGLKNQDMCSILCKAKWKLTNFFKNQCISFRLKEHQNISRVFLDLRNKSNAKTEIQLGVSSIILTQVLLWYHSLGHIIFFTGVSFYHCKTTNTRQYHLCIWNETFGYNPTVGECIEVVLEMKNEVNDASNTGKILYCL